jgi:hypothetical protein
MKCSITAWVAERKFFDYYVAVSSISNNSNNNNNSNSNNNNKNTSNAANRPPVIGVLHQPRIYEGLCKCFSYSSVFTVLYYITLLDFDRAISFRY